MGTKQPKSIALEVTVPYTLEHVWQAFTRKEALSQWMSVRVMETDFEPQPGYKFTLKSKPNRFWRGFVDCEVIEIVPLQKIKFTWQSMAHHKPTMMTYAFANCSGGTNIGATLEGFDRSHGLLSGLFLRVILKAGMKKEFTQFLPQVLENGKNGDFGKVVAK